MIIASHTCSKVDHIDLDSTHLSCAVQSQASLRVLEPCTVQLDGMKTNGKCTYAGTVLNQALMECTFPTSKLVKSVNVTAIKSAKK